MEKIIISLVTTVIQFGMFVLFITLAVIHRKKIRETAPVAILVGIVTMFLGLPLQILVYKNIDVQSLVQPHMPETMDWHVLGPVVHVFVVIAGMAAILFSAVYCMFCYIIAYGEWGKIVPRPFPVLTMRFGMSLKLKKRFAEIGIASGTGVVLAAASYFAFLFLNVGASREMDDLFRQFPDLFMEPGWIQAIVLSFFFVSAAITEEIMFRGALLGFFLRITKNRFAYYIVFAIVVSAIWAFFHFYNTNAPLIKLGQVFLIGLLLSEAARRWSLESAIAFHVSLNISSVILELLFPIT
ncbi:MAG: CPBP family intramembrane metalloprotease [Spirochaetales bacterium]|nr:CPBP family intramembrane metalloprotease [Spirochaetales bacterium]